MSMIDPFVIRPAASLLQDHPQLNIQANRLSEDYEKKRKIEDTQLKTMGNALWEALALGDTLDKAKQVAGVNAPLPLIIDTMDTAIFSLPWETLHHPTYGFLGREAGFTLTWHQPVGQRYLPPIKAEPLRVLLFTSLPDDLGETGRLEVEAEQAMVQQALMEAEQRGEVRLETPDDGRFETFRETLQTFKPHVVYLSGHGLFTHDLANDQAHGSFLFEDQWGQGQSIKETELVACFQNTGVQLLVLSACLSARQHPNYPDNGLTAALYRAGIPHVIGMRESVFDIAGIQFAQALMGSLAERQSLGVALQRGRAAITQTIASDILIPKQVNSPERVQLAQAHWCLPQLLSHHQNHPLTDWQFTPQARTPDNLHGSLGNISIPQRFIGRRRELRAWQQRLHTNELNQLLITGAGGMGKTALAGKLVAGLSKAGYQLFSFSLRPEHDWQDVLLDMELALAEDDVQYKKFELIQKKQLSEAKQAEWFLKLLLARYQGKLVLFFDNLESVQSEQTPYALTETTLNHWIEAARRLNTQGLKLILTSRWQLPDWADAAHYSLGRPVYGDFLAFARQQALPHSFITHPKRLKRAFEVLGGNFRALEFFARASEGMVLSEEQAFLDKLKQAEAQIQVDMALAAVVSRCTPAERCLLEHLRAYPVPVPVAGIKRLVAVNPLPRNTGAETDTTPLTQAEHNLHHLLAVSLIEQQFDAARNETLYQLSPLVRSWLDSQTDTLPTPRPLLQAAANFLLWQLEKDGKTHWGHRLTTHQALQHATLTDKAHRLVLDWIVGPLNNAGLYQVLITEWLPLTITANDPQTKGEAFVQLGNQHRHIGDYDTSFKYLKQALEIQQKIGDKSGEGATLNNISLIYDARGDYDTALQYLKQALEIQQQVGDKSGEGTTLNNISLIFNARGDYDTALQYLQQALEIQQQVGDKSGEGTILNNISLIYDARGDYDTALQYLKQSLEISQEVSDKSGEGTTLNNISQIYDARGDYDTALQYLKQSLEIKQDIGDKSGEGTTLNNISQIFKARGDYDTAFQYLKQALEIQQDIGDKSSEGTTLNNISLIFKARGDCDTAFQYLKQSLEIRQEIGDKSGEGTTLNNIATNAHARGDYDTALQYLKQSLKIQQDIGDKLGEGATLNNISAIYNARGDYDTALQYLKQSLEIRQEIGDVAGLCATLFNMGHIHLQNEEQAEAIQAWVTVYGLAKKMNLAQALEALGNLAGQLGLPDGLDSWEALAQKIGKAE